MNVNFNRKLMALSAKDLTARAEDLAVKNKPDTKTQKHYAGIKRINVIDMEKGVATFNYGRNVDFIEIERIEDMLERNRYEITSANFSFSREKGVNYTINFEPRDEVA